MSAPSQRCDRALPVIRIRRVEVNINLAELKRTTAPAVEVRRTYPAGWMPPSACRRLFRPPSTGSVDRQARRVAHPSWATRSPPSSTPPRHDLPADRSLSLVSMSASAGRDLADLPVQLADELFEVARHVFVGAGPTGSMKSRMTSSNDAIWCACSGSRSPSCAGISIARASSATAVRASCLLAAPGLAAAALSGRPDGRLPTSSSMSP